MVSQEWLRNLAKATLNNCELTVSLHPSIDEKTLKEQFHHDLLSQLQSACISLNQWRQSRGQTYHTLIDETENTKITLLLGRIQLSLHIEERLIRAVSTVIEQFRPVNQVLGEFKLIVNSLNEAEAILFEHSRFSPADLAKWALQEVTKVYLSSQHMEKVDVDEYPF